ncbi:DUF2752 domain-containing protein [candidate division KSB1 bacterium]|nr:DUF2752 domain-containing protein [candidate division KSB1 bacterium]
MKLIRLPLSHPEAHRLETYAGLLAIVAIFLISLLVPPFEQSRFTMCLFKNLTGVPCPSCGMTRAFLFLGHGRILQASALNPLALPVALLLLLQGVRLLLRLATLADYRLQLSPFLFRILMVVIFLLCLGLWLFRILSHFHVIPSE